MQTRKIGSLTVSTVGLGCNNFGMKLDAAETEAVVDAALAAGITHFDTADIYGGTKSEEYLGQALGARRKDIVLATKFGMAVDEQHKGARPEYVRQACADSLRRLGTDYIDLYWLHTPDDSVPIADTLGALHELIEQGKVREIACSNFSPAQLREARAEAQRLGGAGFAAVQNEYSLLHREPELAEDSSQPQRGVLAECQRQDLTFVPYFPLASGLLTGKYRAGHEPPPGSRLATSARAGRFLNEHNMAVVERLLAWLQHTGSPLRHMTGVPTGSPSAGPLIPSASAPGFTLLPTEPAGIPTSVGNYDIIAGSAAGPAEEMADLAGEAWQAPHGLLDLAIAWLLAQPQVASVIAGATTPEQVRANAGAAQWELTQAEVETVRRIIAGAPA